MKCIYIYTFQGRYNTKIVEIVSGVVASISTERKTLSPKTKIES